MDVRTLFISSHARGFEFITRRKVWKRVKKKVGGGREENRTFQKRGGAELSGMGEKKRNDFRRKEKRQQKLMTRETAERG